MCEPLLSTPTRSRITRCHCTALTGNDAPPQPFLPLSLSSRGKASTVSSFLTSWPSPLYNVPALATLAVAVVLIVRSQCEEAA